MDRASILGDAIEYLKDLLQRIHDLDAELEATPAERILPPSPPALPPSTLNLPCRVKEEPMSSVPISDPQPAKVSSRVHYLDILWLERLESSHYVGLPMANLQEWRCSLVDQFDPHIKLHVMNCCF